MTKINERLPRNGSRHSRPRAGSASVPAQHWGQLLGSWGQLSFPLQPPQHPEQFFTTATSNSTLFWGKQRGKWSLPRLQSGRKAEPSAQGSALREAAALQGNAWGAGHIWGTGLSTGLGFPPLQIRSAGLSPGTLLDSPKPIRCLNN